MSREELVLLVTLGAYAAALLAFGVAAGRRVRGPEDWFVGGRSFGPWMVGATVFASTITGFAFLGGPGLVLRFGSSSFWILVTGTIGAPLAILLAGRAVQRIGQRTGACTLPEVLGQRYGGWIAPALGAIVLVLGSVGYLGLQLQALVRAIEVVAPSFAAGSGPYLLPGLALLIALYAVAGGAYASVWTDALQAVLMGLASLAAGGLAFAYLAQGGVRRLAELDAPAFEAFGSAGVWTAVGFWIVFGLGNAGQPQVLTRFLMASGPDAVRRAMPIVLVGGTLAALLWLGLGTAGRSLVIGSVIAEPEQADAIALLTVRHLGGAWLGAVLSAGLVSAILSSADTFLGLAAGALARDVPRLAGRSLSPRAGLLAAQAAAAGVLALAAWLAASHQGPLATLGIFGWGLWAAAFVPTLALGLALPGVRRGAAELALGCALLVIVPPALQWWAWPFPLAPNACALLLGVVIVLAWPARFQSSAGVSSPQ